MKFSLLVLTLLYSLGVIASGDKGNIIQPWDGFYGGDAVVCRHPNKKIKAATLLDYVETDKHNRKTAPVAYQEELTDLQYVNALATKLEKIAPDVFGSFRREAVRLAVAFDTYNKKKITGVPQVIMVPGKSLPQIFDSYHRTTNMKGCEVEQLVIREKKYKTVVYYVESEIYSQMSPLHRRGIILHEAIYHSFNMYYGDSDSARARFFHRNITQFKLSELTSKILEEYLRNAFVKF